MAKVASNSSLAKRWILKMLFNGCVVSLQEDWNYQREWWPKYFKAGMVGMLRTLGLQTMVLLQHVWMALPVSSTYLAHPRMHSHTHTCTQTRTHTHAHTHTHSLSLSLLDDGEATKTPADATVHLCLNHFYLLLLLSFLLRLFLFLSQ